MLPPTGRTQETECEVCGKTSLEISAALEVCADCIRNRFEEARPLLEKTHDLVRSRYNLPPEIPQSSSGVRCSMCGNRCEIPTGEKGYCGIVANDGGKLKRLFGTPERGLLRCYKDDLPTNCVSAWRCAGSSGAGYPKWCRTPEGDIGYKNLAVFLGSCTQTCLFCQNASFRDLTTNGEPTLSAGELAGKADEGVGCICYFGGDPSSQMPFVIKSAELAREEAEREDRILRICLETNLVMNESSLEEIAEISMESGGGIKADIKFWSSELLYAICGIDHKTVYDNFETIGKRQQERPEVPFARASTLLIPGYIGEFEIRKIASFIADIDPTIPYSLLAFHPAYFMSDMPRLKRSKADEFLEICKEEGLEKVRIGNPWLLV